MEDFRAVDAKPFETAHLSELDAIPVSGTLVWRPIRRRFDIGAFGVNAYTAENAGDELVEDHDELGSGGGEHEELYYVASGHATFSVGGEEVDAPEGTLIFIRDAAVRRHAVAKEPKSTVLAIGGPRDEAFHPSAWELWFAAGPHVEAGEYDKAAQMLADGMADHPDNPSLLYNLGCFEALAGDHDAAIAHVQRAFELNPELREHAAIDSGPGLDPRPALVDYRLENCGRLRALRSPAFLRSTMRASRVKNPSRFRTVRSSGSASMSARAIPCRSAPACPAGPPPWSRALMSNVPSTPAVRSGIVATVRSTWRGKYSSRVRPLIHVWPSPGRRMTRATEVLRFPVP